VIPVAADDPTDDDRGRAIGREVKLLDDDLAPDVGGTHRGTRDGTIGGHGDRVSAG
jgi:hypothetical protein